MNMVLVVNKRPEQANALAESLGILGVDAVTSALDSKLAIRALVAHQVQLILIDVDASAEGLAFCDTVRDLSPATVLVRGPLSRTDLALAYLERGAADYCGKTTPPAVLAAKIKSLTRMEPDASLGKIVFAGDLAIDLQNRRVLRGTTEISLTPLEFRLLAVLAQNIGRPCSHRELLARVWGEHFTNCAHYVRLYIGYLRQKLEDDPGRPRLLLNDWGYGYRLAERGLASTKAPATNALRLAQS